MLSSWISEKLAWRQKEALNQASRAAKGLFSGNGMRFTAVIMLFIQALGVVFFDTPINPSGPELDLTGYELVFEDDFDCDELDLDAWAFRGNGRRRAGYFDSSQAWVEDGNLIVQAEYKDEGTYGEGWYAAMLRTQEEFLYGYFEIDCISNLGGGFWSAFWLNSRGMNSAEASAGGVGGSEIDIFEAFNYRDGRLSKDSVSLNVHVGGYGEGLRSIQLGNYYGKNIYTEMNTYGMMWTPEEYIFYVNGVEAVRSDFQDGVSEFWEYAIISLEVPEEITESPGFTTQMIVDRVRIYQTEEMRQLPPA